MNLVIIIPAFNEAAVISNVIKKIPKKFSGVSKTEIVIVDDGSSDLTAQIAKNMAVKVLSHKLNRGAGAATKTGLLYAKKRNADIIVTFDADGQHHPEDIKKIIRPIIEKKSDLVIGSRFLKNQRVPLDRLIINWGANIITFFLFGIFSSDSQSGLRAFSKRANEVIDFKSDRMEFSSEILLESKRNHLKIVEVPTKAIYTDYSKFKGQRNSNALPVMMRILTKLLR